MQTNRIKNPRKQRKMLYNAPAHKRHKLMAAPLSKELAASKGAKTLPVRKGDTVRIQRGDHKGFEGKISRVDLKEYRIYLEGLTREKTDGTNIFLPIHPSKVQIRNLNLDDKWRKTILGRKKAPVKEEKAKVKPAKKAEKIPAKVKDAAPQEEKEVVEKKPAKKIAAKTKITSKKTIKEIEVKKAVPKGQKKKTSEEEEE
jgi:large subunit ribosomal protein L24